MTDSKAYTKNVTVSLQGVIEATGDFFTIKENNEQTFSFACPEDAANGKAVKMNQRYVCAENPDEHGIHLPAEVETRLRVEADKSQVLVSKDEIEEAKVSELPPNFLDIQVFKAESVQGSLLDVGTSYVFVNQGSGRQFGMLVEVIKRRPDLVLMGQMNHRKKDKLFRLTVDLNGQLVLREQAWPEDVKAFSAPDYQYKKALLPTMEQLVESLAEEFSTETYTNEARSKLAALATSKATKAAPTKTKIKAVAADEDSKLEALLKAALEAQKTKAS